MIINHNRDFDLVAILYNTMTIKQFNSFSIFFLPRIFFQSKNNFSRFGNNYTMNNLPPNFEIISKFIINNYNKFRKESNITNKPLIIGLSGTQGCGKFLIQKIYLIYFIFIFI
jgi:hypothetical protein